MTRRRRPIPPPPPGPLGGWTIQRATVAGIALGLSALLLSATLGSWPGPLLYLYAALLALTIGCGASILFITMKDIRTRGRGGRMRPIRAFDIAMGLALALPAAYALWLIWPEL
ncbi:MAG TPA: hypothetical protein VEW71_02960 [Allosphingosinicella sp.]|nr:hypothetical protein [Allosphingosinicella sp.]